MANDEMNKVHWRITRCIYTVLLFLKQKFKEGAYRTFKEKE